MALLLSLLFFFAALFFFLRLHQKKAHQTCRLPPSPPKLPIIGNLHQLGAHPHRSLSSLSDKHGPLMLLHLGQIPTLIVSSADMAEEILKTHDHVFASRPSTTAARQILYGCTDIVFAPYGEYWRQMRKVCVVELLSAKRVSSFRSIREEEVGLMMKEISQSCAAGAAVNLTELLLSLSSGVISRAALGKKYGGEKGKNELAHLVGELTTFLTAFSVGDYFPSLGWIDVLTGLDAGLKRNSRGFDAFLDQVVEDHLIREKMEGGKDEGERDFVDVLLKVQKDSTLDIRLTKTNLKAIILDMFGAGTDATANTLEWAMAELIKHPNVMKKAQEEIRRVVGENRKVKEEDLHQFHYLKLIIKETMRLHPHAPLLFPREATNNVMVKDYYIPAKTRVLVNAWAIGREPKSWKNAEEFFPERFANTLIDFKGLDFQFIPFGAGRRGCPGISFGINLVELALANLLYWFNWEMPNGLTKEDLDMSESLGIVVRMKFPLHLVSKQYYHVDV